MLLLKLLENYDKLQLVFTFFCHLHPDVHENFEKKITEFLILLLLLQWVISPQLPWIFSKCCKKAQNQAFAIRFIFLQVFEWVKCNKIMKINLKLFIQWAMVFCSDLYYIIWFSFWNNSWEQYIGTSSSKLTLAS